MKKDIFLKKTIEKHGNFYDYSKVPDNFTQKEKICIICPEHGEFWQIYTSHLRNSCPKCANKKRGKDRLTTEQFIEKAKEVHGDKYDYSKVEYINYETNVCIICPKHGEFWQTPVNHILGHDCPKCKGRGLNTEEIIEKFKEVHGDKYDYSKVEFTKMHEKVCIICPEHGEFWQTTSKHLIGRGCPKCGKISAADKQSLTNEEFIERAKKVHGDKYSYENTKYENMHMKVEITCQKHGVFYQRPDGHLNGFGCYKCAESHLEEKIKKLLEENNIKYIEKCNNKTFKWLEKQHLDFYLPEYNTAIECQGEQHFKPIEFFNGINGFKEVVKRDNIKRIKCKENGVNLLYFSNSILEFPYNVFTDENKLLKEIKEVI